MMIFLLFGVSMGAVTMTLFAASRGRKSQADASRVQGWALLIMALVTLQFWLPLLFEAQSEHRMCGMEAFFRIVPPLFLTSFLMGAFPVWLSRRLRLPKDVEGSSSGDPDSEWKTVF